MKKISYGEMVEAFRNHNKSFGLGDGDERGLRGVIVFKASNWPGNDYGLESRSYMVSSTNKAWIDGMGGYSIFGSSLDGSDICVRLDGCGWEVDYCYML